MRITTTAPTAIYLATATLAAVSKDDINPVITAVHLTKHGRALRATSTDRYRIHEVTISAVSVTAAKGESVLVPSSAFRWLVKAVRQLAPRRLDRDLAGVTIQTRGDRVIVTIDAANGDSLSLSTSAVPGNFPPVHRLFTTAEEDLRAAGDVRLNPAYIAALNALRPDLATPPPLLKFTAAKNSAHPGPVLATVTADGITARALINPNLSR